MYKQRDIILIPFPYSDLTGSKQRPALVISNERINKTEDRICCLVTSNIHKDDLLVLGKDFEEGKLPLRSAVKPHRIFTIHERIVIKKLCTVTHDFHDQVFQRIQKYLERA